MSLTTFDMVGLGLFMLGVVIFFVSVKFSKRFRKYVGINEYKRVRAEIMEDSDYDAESEPEIGDTSEFEDNGVFRLTKSIGSIVGLVISMYVMGNVIEQIGGVMNDSAFVGSMMMLKSVIPLIGILGLASIVLPIIWGD